MLYNRVVSAFDFAASYGWQSSPCSCLVIENFNKILKLILL